LIVNISSFGIGPKISGPFKIIQELYLDEEILWILETLDVIEFELALQFHNEFWSVIAFAIVGSLLVVFQSLDRYQRYFGSR